MRQDQKCLGKNILKRSLSFSIEDFGKSAPYKKVYRVHFGLSSEKISKKIKFYLKMTIKIGINGMEELAE